MAQSMLSKRANAKADSSKIGVSQDTTCREISGGTSQLTEPSANPEDQEDDERLLQFMTGIKEDFNANIVFYADDWKIPKNLPIVLNASLFAFSIQLIPALIFAELIDRKTEGHMATAEVFLSTFIMGVIYAVFSGQPLVILGVTGPVAILIGTAYKLSLRLEMAFFPFFFWICIWCGLLHVITSVIGLVGLVWKVTPFTTQIFEFFVAFDFIYISIRDLIEPVALSQGDYREDRSPQYASIFVATTTFYIAWTLTYAESWVFFNKRIRKMLNNYHTLIALAVGTAVSYLPGVDLSADGQVGLDRVSIRFSPWDWKPTADRSWIVDPFEGMDGSRIAFAFIPGFMFYLLFMIDHNIGSILTQSAKFNLKKPPAFHWDFFVLGFTFIHCALLGVPPGNGLIPQSPMVVRALCTRTVITDENGQRRETYAHCEEQRWSPLIQSCLFLVALASFPVLRLIPRGCLFGLFLYLGMNMMNGNEIWQRILLNVVAPENRPPVPIVTHVPWNVTQMWTIVQVCLACSVFAVVTFTPLGFVYPLLLVLLVPIRVFVMERFFETRHTKYLNPHGQTDEEFHEEQKALRIRLRSNIDEINEFNLPHLGEFRGQHIRVPSQVPSEVFKFDDIMNEEE